MALSDVADGDAAATDGSVVRSGQDPAVEDVVRQMAQGRTAYKEMELVYATLLKSVAERESLQRGVQVRGPPVGRVQRTVARTLRRERRGGAPARARGGEPHSAA
jgi:hypothetical protein